MILSHDAERRIYAAVQTLRMTEPTEPERCIWCNADPVDPQHDPYCSAQCAIEAEVDSVD